MHKSVSILMLICDMMYVCAAAGGLHGDSCGAVLVCNPNCNDLVAQQDSSHTLPHLLCIRLCLEW